VYSVVQRRLFEVLLYYIGEKAAENMFDDLEEEAKLIKLVLQVNPFL